MTLKAQETGKGKRGRRPLGIGELLSVGFFVFATVMMMADYVAVAARPLAYLPGIASWYVTSLPWIGAGFVVVCWLSFRRWLGAWVPLLAYVVFMVVSTNLTSQTMAARVETIELTRPMDSQDKEGLESAIGEKVYAIDSSGHPRLMIRRDPQVHERAVRWLAEHGR